MGAGFVAAAAGVSAGNVKVTMTPMYAMTHHKFRTQFNGRWSLHKDGTVSDDIHNNVKEQQRTRFAGVVSATGSSSTATRLIGRGADATAGVAVTPANRKNKLI